MKLDKLMAGEHIKNVALGAAADALLEGETVEFTFNEIPLVVPIPKNTADIERVAEEVVTAYSSECEKRSEAYRDSPEGRAAAQARADEIVRLQREHDNLMHELPRLRAGDHSAWMGWLKRYARVADDVGVRRDFAIVIVKLEAASYRENDLVIPDDASERYRAEAKKNLRTRPEHLARYIAGQALNCMKGGGSFGPMPPHPVTIGFIEDFEKLSRGEPLPEKGRS